MDHPLISEDHSDLRRRVVRFLKEAYRIARTSNVIFVCGGKDAAAMRMRFKDYCENNAQTFDLFMPEDALEAFFKGGAEQTFDLADFEELVGELSHAIVVFPEAAGSYAETGYFSAIEPLARRTILVLDSQYQGSDSFISLGPAKKFNATSHFQPNVQLNYANPDFAAIVARIRRIPQGAYKKTLNLEPFSKVTSFEHFSLIHEVVRILRAATIDDIIYILRALSKATVSTEKTRKLASILVGSKHLLPIGEFGHLRVNSSKKQLLEVRNGFNSQEAEIFLELASIYQSSEPEFKTIALAPHNAN